MELTEDESNFMETATKGGGNGGLSIGPFTITNKTIVSNKLTDEEKKKYGNATKIEISDGMQLIAVKNSLLSPEFPSADQPAEQPTAIAKNVMMSAVLQTGEASLAVQATADVETINPIVMQAIQQKME